MLKLAIISASTITSFVGLTIPALGAFVQAFPETNPVIIKSITTIPPLMLVIFSLLSGRICRLISKRNVLILSSFCILIGGTVPAFYGDIYFILFMRLIFGIGYGLGFPVTLASIMEYFQGNERVKLMGVYMAISSITGILIKLLGGYLAQRHWRTVFWGHSLILISMIVVIIAFPKEKKNPPSSKEIEYHQNQSNPRGFSALKGITYFLGILPLFSSFSLWAFFNNISIVLTQEKLGGPGFASILMSMESLFMFSMGIIFQKIYRVLKNYTAVVGIIIFGLSFFFLSKSHTGMEFIIASCVLGIGYGTYYPSIHLAIGGSVRDPKNVNAAVSFGTSAMGIGQFISAYAMAAMTTLFKISGGRGEWLLAMILCMGGGLTGAVVILLYYILEQNRGRPVEQEKHPERKKTA
ncbi:MFS transporter [Treponema primitia]|uniref:MFS transporter n=1 Tax=Treponema primitia TaxID=88058 RepID=UPI003981670F